MPCLHKHMKIVLASRNRKKIAEMHTLLHELGGVFANVEILSLDDIGYEGDIQEDGTTFAENALIKASVPASYGFIGIADDSGLAVDALGGAPGVYSARYAGEPCNDENNNKKLLSELENTPDKERTGRYVCAIACVFPDGRSFTVEGYCKGLLLREYRGEGGFGYDPLFLYPEYNKTFAEIPLSQKNKVSHRARAIAAFAKEFSKYILPSVELTSKARAYLRSLSHSMQPIFQIGKGGITEEICRVIGNALEARELIKVNTLETAPFSPRETAEAIAFATGATVVSVMGRRFVLYRPSEEHKEIVLP